MKVSFVLLIVALIIAVCSAAVQHSEPSQGQINYCVMCNTTAQCAHGTNHTCTMVNLGQCTLITSKCDGNNSTFYIKASQNNQTVTTQNFDQDSKCNSDGIPSNQVTCEGCSADGSAEVLCYVPQSSSSDASSFVIPSIFVIIMIILASFI
ncbi:hypothetical protein DICPUDRAFT_91234 [Dictyostelium purpureum]|uniref:Uncharacterized protein n=1 Tax=Dictyostelium purpureum TaxID=5786 RepID=F0Z9I4_DICPU|nr:uncharacterized protein DICPUDRAFT_91234 [Dictyostelium purpureum]EGC39390.1 hypothetical protein DICPUDRAFT_91234 [Dictyostelium purpureum]|eukprot:XP_003284064.1 hypothetical protein DICPUDRAFT_91234 [Dictyostelium purpureum]